MSDKNKHSRPVKTKSQKTGSEKSKKENTNVKKNDLRLFKGSINKKDKVKLFKTIGLAVLIVILAASAAYYVSSNKGLNLFGSGSERKINDGDLFYDVQPDNVKDIQNYDSGLAVLTNTSLEYIDSSGRVMETNKHSFANPVMNINGKTVFIYNKGGSEYRIEKSSAIYETKNVTGVITCGALGKTNNYGFSLNNDGGYQSHVFVYSANGEKQFEWGSSSDYCIDLALSDNGRKAAVSVVGAKNAEYYSKIILFDFNSGTPEYTVDFSGETVYKLDFVSSTKVGAFTDSGVYIIDRSGEITPVQEFTSSEIKHSFITEDGLRATVISLYGNEQTPLVTVLDEHNRVIFTRNYYEDITGIICGGSYICLSMGDRIEILNRDNRVLGDIDIGEQYEKAVLSNHTLYVLNATGIHTYNVFFDTHSASRQEKTTAKEKQTEKENETGPTETTTIAEETVTVTEENDSSAQYNNDTENDFEYTASSPYGEEDGSGSEEEYDAEEYEDEEYIHDEYYDDEYDDYYEEEDEENLFG